MQKTPQPDLKTAHAATIAGLTEVTHDPIDAMRLAADLFAMSAFRAERAVALEAGAPSPRTPKTQSRYLRTFIAILKVKLIAIAGMFGAEEIDRLKKLGPSLARRLAGNDQHLADQVYELVCMPSDDAVAWIRQHLDDIEIGLAS